MNTETPAVTPDLIRARLRCAAQALQEAESVVQQAAQKQPLRFGTLAADLDAAPMAAWDHALASRASKAKRRPRPLIKQHWRFKRLIHPRRTGATA